MMAKVAVAAAVAVTAAMSTHTTRKRWNVAMFPDGGADDGEPASLSVPLSFFSYVGNERGNSAPRPATLRCCARVCVCGLEPGVASGVCRRPCMVSVNHTTIID